MDTVWAFFASLLALVKKALPFLQGVWFEALREEANRQAMNAQITKEAYETYGDNLDLDDAELRDRVRQRIDRGDYL